MNPLHSRRQFLATSGAASLSLLGANRLFGEEAKPNADDRVGFFFVSDTHYLAQADAPSKLDEFSQTTNGRLVDTLNRLAGTEIPAAAGGGSVLTPRGVIHGGDVIDSGDKNGPAYASRLPTEWAGFVDDFGLNGGDGRLKYPVYEVHGNHDSPRGDGMAVKNIMARNKKRAGLKNVSENSLHYSWDWGPLHMVNLGISVGPAVSTMVARRYNPLASLPFLIDDLAKNVGESGRPVVLVHHLDVARYSAPPADPEKEITREWDSTDVGSYYAALQKYNIIAILYGHTHVRNIMKWNGTPQKAEQGFTLCNVDNSGHFGSKTQSLFYFEYSPRELTIREYTTADRWETGSWTPQIWSSVVAKT
jgi:predicted phosphodiesterase